VVLPKLQIANFQFHRCRPQEQLATASVAGQSHQSSTRPQSSTRKVQDERAQDGELSGLIDMRAHWVVAKDSIPVPTQALLDAPVPAASFMRCASGAKLFTQQRRAHGKAPENESWVLTAWGRKAFLMAYFIQRIEAVPQACMSGKLD